MAKSMTEQFLEAVEIVLQPFREKMTEARRLQEGWKTLQAEATEYEDEIRDLIVETKKLAEDPEVAPRFAAKKSLEIEATVKILQSRLDQVLVRAAKEGRPFSLFVQQMINDRAWEGPLKEVNRRRYMRAYLIFKERNNYSPTLPEIMGDNPAPRIPHFSDLVRVQYADPAEGTELARRFYWLESVFLIVENYVRHNVYLFADDRFNADPNDYMRSGPGSGPSPLMNARYVSTCHLGFEGSNFIAGGCVDSLPQASIDRLLKSGHVVPVNEWRRRQKASKAIEDLSGINPSPIQSKCVGELIATSDFQFNGTTYWKGAPVQSISPEYIATLMTLDKITSREEWSRREEYLRRARQFAAA
jgi:hypothetical protein